MLNVRPKDLLDRARAPAATGRALHPVPRAWRVSRLTMSPASFFAIIGVWVGGLAILLAVALTFRWS